MSQNSNVLLNAAIPPWNTKFTDGSHEKVAFPMRFHELGWKQEMAPKAKAKVQTYWNFEKIWIWSQTLWLVSVSHCAKSKSNENWEYLRLL